MRINTFFSILLALVISACSQVQSLELEKGANSQTLSVDEADWLLSEAGADYQAKGAIHAEDEYPAPKFLTKNELPDETMIQTALKNLGLYDGEVDGRMGPKTREAVREFQVRNNLKDDGKVGLKTWVLLKEAL